tara:strand:+ start:1457 stop:2224 length:768 start_codon:yes stop_codon:yes gene_type:complete
MIDSHCHLDHEPLYSDIDNVLKRSKLIGVKKFLTIGTNLKTFSNITALINKYDEIYATFGIHPHETDNTLLDVIDIVKYAKNNKKIIGIGESGLDFYYNNSDKKTQIQSFENHIEASISCKKPIIVHSRNAENETFEILKKYEKSHPKILMHCFTGSTEFSKKLFDLNVYFSASGIITFNNSDELQKTFSQIPVEKLLIETDSPYLAPIPMRGKKNEPSFIIHTLKKLSQIKNIDQDKLNNITTNNFNNLFFNEK